MRTRSVLGIGTLSPLNRELLDHWRSLLPSPDDPPPLASFDLPTASGHHAGAALMDVRIGEAVTCRYAGVLFSLAMGAEMAGQDLLAFSPAAERQQRLIRYSAVAQGAVGVARRTTVSPATAQTLRLEAIMLPFAPEGEIVPVLLHHNWRPQGDEWLAQGSADALRLADEFFLIGL